MSDTKRIKELKDFLEKEKKAKPGSPLKSFPEEFCDVDFVHTHHNILDAFHDPFYHRREWFCKTHRKEKKR